MLNDKQSLNQINGEQQLQIKCTGLGINLYEPPVAK